MKPMLVLFLAGLALANFGINDLRTWSDISRYFTPHSSYTDDFGAYAPLLKMDNGDTITTEAQLIAHQTEIRQNWRSIAGDMPVHDILPYIIAVKDSVHFSHIGPGATFYLIELAVAKNWSMEATLIIPDGSGPFPAIVSWYYFHHRAAGFDQASWGVFDTTDAVIYYRAFGYHAAKLGIASLNMSDASSHWGDDEAWFDGAAPTMVEAYYAEGALKYLQSRDDVDPNRIGIVGHSYGGKNAYFNGAWNPGYACIAASGGGCRDLNNSNWNDAPYFDGKRSTLQAAGHDFQEITGLTYPRPVIFGGSPDLNDIWTSLNHTYTALQQFGRGDRIGHMYRPEHAPDDSSMIVFYSFFKHFLIDTQIVINPLSAKIRAEQYCIQQGDTVDFHAQGLGGVFPYTYTWYMADQGTAGSRHPSQPFQTSGINQVALTITDAQGWTAADTLYITVGYTEETLFDTGAVWKYSADGTNYTTFYQTGYNDNAWSSGQAPVGHAYWSYFQDPVTEVITSGLYLRKTFSIPTLANATHIRYLWAQSSGTAFWLNGADLQRINIKPKGDIPHDFGCEGGDSPSADVNEYRDRCFSLDSISLAEGNNVAAVTVRAERGRSDNAIFDGAVYLIRAANTDTIKPGATDVRRFPKSSTVTLTIHPNPVSARSVIRTSGPAAITVYDIRGRQVADWQRLLRTGKLPEGIYLIQAVSGKHTAVRPVTVIR